MKLGPLFADILVADRARELVREVRTVLQNAGYIVHRVEGARALLEAIALSPPDLILFSGVLLDTEGYDVIRHLKHDRARPFIPIVVVADRGGADEIATALNAGADEFLRKPLSKAELLLRVRAMLRLKQATDALAELNATLEEKVVERTRALEEAHARLRHAEKLSALGRLAASIAHDINSPLASINNYLYLIESDLPPDSPVVEEIRFIKKQIDRITKLVKQLRDFSRPPRAERYPIRLQDVLDDVLRLVDGELKKNQIRVVRDLPADLPQVMASPDQMTEVFLNLILNARDAMPDGGVLTLRGRVEGDEVVVEVEDTGIGIPEEIQGRIFEPFFTTKGEGGTGLGLAICYRIVQEHGGEITVDSRVGGGATFAVRLPRLRE